MEKSTQIRSFLIATLIGFASLNINAQHRKMDRLEQYYDQGHYKMVYRKSTRMLRHNEYDYSIIPSYYRAMSSFQLMHSPSWMRRYPSELKECVALMNTVIQSAQWSALMKSHANELADMELLFDVWLAGNSSSNNGDHMYMEKWILEEYKTLKYNHQELINGEQNESISHGLTGQKRLDLIHYAYEFMGVPYKWGGGDENGFDCSGFTKHVFKFQNIDLPRVSKDQYTYAEPIKENRAHMGDLVFFSDGKGVSHVGLLVNDINEPKTMIHSSSSKGISVAGIDASTYWSKRLVGYGRIIK
jgi:hypothetical protein